MPNTKQDLSAERAAAARVRVLVAACRRAARRAARADRTLSDAIDRAFIVRARARVAEVNAVYDAAEDALARVRARRD